MFKIKEGKSTYYLGVLLYFFRVFHIINVVLPSLNKTKGNAVEKPSYSPLPKSEWMVKHAGIKKENIIRW